MYRRLFSRWCFLSQSGDDNDDVPTIEDDLSFTYPLYLRRIILLNIVLYLFYLQILR